MMVRCMSLTVELPCQLTKMSILLLVETGLTVHLVNAMINCGNPECNRQILASEANEAAYLGGCSHECRVHPRNRYVVSHNLSEAEVTERPHAIHEIVASIK